ncbi:MAG TPA: hypothetical protein DCS28_02795 [Candidatus Moranbacteria bacterium]|nr:hypothetical protein [Candidatus Moranbacteria bacterium]HAT74944.1 hypothetical protein [Candidatus Moranbacteria bacterium]
MDLLSCNWDNAKFLIFSDNVFDPLIYYSHLGPLLLSVALLLLIFFSNKKDLSNKILIFLLASFCLWSLSDLILWATEKPQYVMFSWSVMIFLDLFMYAAAFYFMYVFIYRKDLPFFGKALIGLLFVPLLILVSTKYNLNFFDLTNCEREAKEGILWGYTYLIEVFFAFLILVGAVIGFLKSEEKKIRKEIVLITSGMILFLVAFSWGNIAGSITEDWSVGQYGLFGIPIFIGFLSYSIVKYQTLNIRVLAVQGFIGAIAILMGAQFFFIRTNLNRVLTAITLFIIFIFGVMLIRSVKKEIQQKEELEIANKEIHKRNAKLKIANAEIQKRNAKLKLAHKEISQRKEELQLITDRLAESNDKLRQLDNAKTEFISMASHQLRTPVTGIKGYVDMLIEGSYGPLTPDQLDAIKKTYTCNERMVALIEDLLNASKIESGRMEYEFANCHIEEICQEVVDTLVNKARDKNLYLDYKKPTTPLPELCIDGKKVREVISNLVDNAVKYTEKGGVTLKIEKNGNTVRIAVSDTGIGIPKEEMPYLFTKFSRGKDVKRLSVSGTGLGLYVGKNMIEGNGGKIWVESEGAGKGSKFIVELEVGRKTHYKL